LAAAPLRHSGLPALPRCATHPPAPLPPRARTPPLSYPPRRPACTRSERQAGVGRLLGGVVRPLQAGGASDGLGGAGGAWAPPNRGPCAHAPALLPSRLPQLLPKHPVSPWARRRLELRRRRPSRKQAGGVWGGRPVAWLWLFAATAIPGSPPSRPQKQAPRFQILRIHVPAPAQEYGGSFKVVKVRPAHSARRPADSVRRPALRRAAAAAAAVYTAPAAPAAPPRFLPGSTQAFCARQPPGAVRPHWCTGWRAVITAARTPLLAPHPHPAFRRSTTHPTPTSLLNIR
jgi:hypothetical protein